MTESDGLLAETAASFVPTNNSNGCQGSSCDLFSNFCFLRQLHFEKLRAQRSKSTLSIILLTLNSKFINTVNMGDILNLVRVNTRDIDICGFANNKTIGVLLPHTDENGAKEVSEKIVGANIDVPFSIFTASYPDHIFESLEKKGCVDQFAFPFALESPIGGLWFTYQLKRAVDIIGSLIGIIALMPVMLATALIIKITSPGPAIFKQIRLGKQGVPFTFYKFRSMYVDMDDQIHRKYTNDFINGDHEKTNQGDAQTPIFKIKSDPRITRVGKFIRKTSIDELPQFFNVLKGDMSLVGPRPPLPYEAEKYQSWHLRRILEMKPGITGLWQVEGRSKTGWDESVRLDIRYIKNWSLLFDFKILLMTVKEVLRGSGAM